MYKMETIPLSSFQVAETKTFEKVKKKIDQSLYMKIKNIVYSKLRENPYFETNIKKLKGELEGYYRYRVGHYRLFYTIDNEKVIVAVIDLKHRQAAYN